MVIIEDLTVTLVSVARHTIVHMVMVTFAGVEPQGAVGEHKHRMLVQLVSCEFRFAVYSVCASVSAQKRQCVNNIRDAVVREPDWRLWLKCPASAVASGAKANSKANA
jgi:hypothetical protein